MTDSVDGVVGPAGLLLAGPGLAEDLSARIAAAASRLADFGGWPLRELAAAASPPQALAALGGGRSTRFPPVWLAALTVDPGLPLEEGGSWAEALGAWRQPTALVLAGDQLATGAPAAATALLRQWRVPLLGLIQWQGRWDADARRRDGLPWLGRLDGGSVAAGPVEGVDELDLLACLGRRWSQLDGE